jgi:hypothetical protein
MAYTPVASDVFQPTGDKSVQSAALEFRTLKAFVLVLDTDLSGFQAELDALQAAIGAGNNSVALAANLANSVNSTLGVSLIGLADYLAYPDGTLGNQAVSIKALRRGRTSPHANFNWFTSDFTVIECQGPGKAKLAQDISDVYQTKFGALIGSLVSYVHPLGSDANDGSSWRQAFLTLNKALRLTTNGIIYVWPGTYDLCDFRHTDSYGDHPKKIIAPYGGVTLRVAGDDPNAATWTLNNDFGGIYQMHVALTNVPIRVLRKDLIDKYGEPTPMPQFADLDTLGTLQNFGWAYNGAYSQGLSVTTTSASAVVTTTNTRSASVGMSISGTGIPGGATIISVTTGSSITMSANATASAAITATVAGRALYIREAMNVNVNTTTKANLQVIYGVAGDNRTLLYSTISYWENITFYGYISVLHVAGQTTPQFWAKRCTFKYGATSSILVEGGYAYTQDCRSYRTCADGGNYNILNAITPHVVEINYTTQFSGDVDTYGLAQTLNPQGTAANKNGSSNHDGYIVRVNGQHYDCFGPNIADTATSYSWNLGVTAGFNAMLPNSIPSNPRYGFVNQANNAWLDGCDATGQDLGFISDLAANSRTFNNFGSLIVTAGGVFTPYVPG